LILIVVHSIEVEEAGSRHLQHDRSDSLGGRAGLELDTPKTRRLICKSGGKTANDCPLQIGRE
jgi:hypothetical protein